MQQTDEQLVEAARQGDSTAMDALLNRYKDVVKKNARAMYLIGGDHDDLLQEGMIGLYKAIRDYKTERGAGFATFANLCISRQLCTAIRHSNTNKNQPLNDYIPLETGEAEEQGAVCYMGVYGVTGNPEELLLEQENTAVLTEQIRKVLSAFEMEVLEMYLEEGNYNLVAQRLEKSPKAIDNALQRIRKKLAEYGAKRVYVNPTAVKASH